MTTTKPRLGVFKFASCDGCQLSLLDCEDELLAVADRVEIAYFLEATRRPLEGEFDVALVEGSVSTPEQENEIRDIRRRSRFLITLGACASHGGIQGLRNFGSLNVENALAIVYASPQYVETLACSRPASAYVAVDLELPGCPINKHQLLGGPGADAGRRPARRYPTTRSAWNASGSTWCASWWPTAHPAWDRSRPPGAGCSAPVTIALAISCFGPAAQPNTAALARRFAQLGLEPEEIRRLFQTFYANAHEFQEEGLRHVEPSSTAG